VIKLAFEAKMDRATFSDPAKTLGVVRQMLSAIRMQLKDGPAMGPEVVLSLLVKADERYPINGLTDAKDTDHDSSAAAPLETH
jgi:hypothetical protein